MKKKLLLMTVIIAMTSVALGQTIQYDHQKFFSCGGSQITITAPSSSDNPIFIKTGLGSFPGMSHTINLPQDTGTWFLITDSVNYTFYVYLVSAPPVEPWTSATTYNCGQLRGQSITAPHQSGTTYLWGTNATTPSITVLQPGTYTVTVTNYCGSVSDTINVLWQGNLPTIPLTGTFCFGSPMILDVFGGPYSYYSWSTGQAGPNVSQIIVDTTATYTVTVTNSGSCQASASTSMIFPEPDSAIICSVDYDPNFLGGKNRVFVQASLDSTVVERKISSTTWEQRFVLAPGETDSIDVTSNPPFTAHSYRAYHKKECGSVGVYSEVHTTIPLSIGLVGSTYSFTWPEYIGFGVNNGPSIYILFGVLPSGVSDSLGYVPGGSFNGQYACSKTIPNCPYVKFYIAFYAPNCNGAKSVKTYTKSPYKPTPIDTTTVSIEEHETQDSSTTEAEQVITTYPNPCTSYIIIDGAPKKSQLYIYDINGKTLWEGKKEDEVTPMINMENLPSGAYIVGILTEEKKLINKHIIKTGR
jgi:hypothetical protein